MSARLRVLRRHLVCQVAATQTQVDEGLAEGGGDALRLLDDEQMAHFVEHGYVLLPLDELPDEFHASLYRKCEARFEETGGKNGKEIFKEIPELHRVLTSKTLQGGLTSVLGRDFTMHPARHMHVSGNRDGGFHKDGGHCSIRHHRQRWAMAMYYPGGCTASMGPTSVIPKSQFLDVIEGKAGAGGRTTGGGAAPVQVEEEVRVVVPPGTILLHHYEISHRATGRKQEDAPWRCMFKLQFARCSEPREPSWNASGGGNPFAGRSEHPWLADCWDWLSGNVGATVTGGSATPTDVLVERLDADTEVERMVAAYSLAEAARCGSTDALQGLTDALQAAESGREANAPYQAGSAKVLPRVAMRGLAASGATAVPPLLALLKHPSPTVVAAAAFALGEAAPPSMEVVNGLHGAFSAASSSLDDTAGAFDLDTPELATKTDALGLRILPEDKRDRMDPEITSVRRVCAVTAQALGIIGARAAAAGSACADVRKELAGILAARLAQPEPGSELIQAGIIRDGNGGSTDKATEVRQQLALAALRLCSTGKRACPIARFLNQVPPLDGSAHAHLTHARTILSNATLERACPIARFLNQVPPLDGSAHAQLTHARAILSNATLGVRVLIGCCTGIVRRGRADRSSTGVSQIYFLLYFPLFSPLFSSIFFSLLQTAFVEHAVHAGGIISALRFAISQVGSGRAAAVGAGVSRP